MFKPRKEIGTFERAQELKKSRRCLIALGVLTAVFAYRLLSEHVFWALWVLIASAVAICVFVIDYVRLYTAPTYVQEIDMDHFVHTGEVRSRDE